MAQTQDLLATEVAAAETNGGTIGAILILSGSTD